MSFGSPSIPPNPPPPPLPIDEDVLQRRRQAIQNRRRSRAGTLFTTPSGVTVGGSVASPTVLGAAGALGTSTGRSY